MHVTRGVCGTKGLRYSGSNLLMLYVHMLYNVIYILVHISSI